MGTKALNTNIIGFKEFRENSEKYIKAVEKGREFTIVRRSSPVFKIVPVDDWGDEGVWETLIDFRKEKGGGVDVRDLLKILNKIKNEQDRKISKKASQ